MSYKIKAGFNPHTPLRVDMRDAALEDHRKVQEIFFALGFEWRSQKGKPQVVKDPSPKFQYYTNYNEKEFPGSYLFWSRANQYNLPTLTPREFYDLVLETEPSLNLTKEHERKYFKNRRGNLVFIANVETELEVELPVLGYEMREGVWKSTAWNLDGRLCKNKELIGDITEEYTPVFEHWNLLTETIVAIAKNANGNWHGFTEIPQKDNYRWTPGGGSHFPLCFLNVQFPECDWEDSLIERPNND